MKALVKKSPQKGIWMQEVPKPTVRPNEILVKLKKTAICGTDLHIYKWDLWSQKNITPPLVIGHEFVGIVEELGPEVEGLKIGERVSGEGHITCGYCRNCRAGRRHLCNNTIGIGIHQAGAFAEYMCLPACNAFKIPDNISDDLASIFDPFGNATHTALSFNLVGEDVLITGAGPIGLMATAIAKHVGARFVVTTDINPYRLELAKKMGATLAIDPREMSLDQAMKQLGMVEGFDVGMEMSGNDQAFTSMIESMNHGGRIALLGLFPENIALNFDQFVFKGLVMKGIYGREMFETWYKMASMLQSGLDIGDVITNQFSIDEFQKGFDLMEKGHSGKVILNWS